MRTFSWQRIRRARVSPPKILALAGIAAYIALLIFITGSLESQDDEIAGQREDIESQDDRVAELKEKLAKERKALRKLRRELIEKGVIDDPRQDDGQSSPSSGPGDGDTSGGSTNTTNGGNDSKQEDPDPPREQDPDPPDDPEEPNAVERTVKKAEDTVRETVKTVEDTVCKLAGC